jgi:diguanylate cyclase (GGDEF)-like protein
MIPAVARSVDLACQSSAALDHRMGRGPRALLVVGLAVFAASLFGLASAHAFSVSFWPANAVLVGLMLRDRSLLRPIGWLGALVGYVAADLLFGRAASLAAFFAVANVIGAMTATALLLRLDPRDLRLRRVHSVLRILACLLPACLAAALCGALLVVIEFHGSALQALTTWPASELVNYLVVLPAMLTVGGTKRSPGETATFVSAKKGLWPALLLANSCAAAALFDGPGSIMFPVPALLLCALTYSVPTTAVVTLALGTACLTMLGLGIMDIGQDMAVPKMVLSVRIAVAFLVLVPLAISSAKAVQDDLLDQLRDAADHDGLTGLLNRRAFELRMQDRLTSGPAPASGLAVLWLDIDHFKRINDRYGHLAGDAVLRVFAETARGFCRANDLVGRLGGEEFALLLETEDAAAAAVVANGLRRAFASQTVLWNDRPVRATVSIGACFVDHATCDVPTLVRQLDEALYRAKRKGRDRIEWLSEPDEPIVFPVRRPERARIAAVA